VRCKFRPSAEILLFMVPALSLFGGAKASTELGGELDRDLEESLEPAWPNSFCLLWTARLKVLRLAATGLPRELRRSRCHCSSAVSFERLEPVEVCDLMLLLSSSTTACSKSLATVLGGASPVGASRVARDGLSLLAMLASVPRRRPSCLKSCGRGKLSAWLRWSSRSGSGVLNLVCVLSGERGVYDKDMAFDVYPISRCMM
jgi:hypothetical protein